MSTVFRKVRMMKHRARRRPFPTACLFLAIILTASARALAQREGGTIRLHVRDPQGGGARATVELVCEANEIHQRFLTRRNGNSVARGLPFGLYRLTVSRDGFVPVARLVEVRSAMPVFVPIVLSLAPLRSHVEVKDSATLVDPERAGTVYTIGSKALHSQIPAQLGRGVLDAVDAEPGWLFEANGVLHPRESEYDVQFVVNGIPLTENRSPAFAPPFASGDVESVRVVTAGFPAEYGRKLGGVVEITTARNFSPGFHAEASAGAGSFDSSTGDLTLGYARHHDQFTVSAHGGMTNRYLDPPVTANYTNRGSTAGVTATYAHDFSDRARLRWSFHHAEVRYEVPNERVQQQAGQLQNAADAETSGAVLYEQVFSPQLLGTVEGSWREEAFQFWSNDLATPVIVSQQRGFRQGYARLTLAGARGPQDWLIGTDAFFTPVHEALQYTLTDPSLFDPGTALRFHFADRRNDFEPAAFAQDNLHFKNWNVGLGLRYDVYDFVVRESAWSPRVAVSRYFSGAQMLVHADYDRVFQTPALENLLLASSPQINRISPLVLRLPVRPASANYYEVGLTKAFWKHLSLTANVFERDFRNFSDDDTLLNTGVSFPIADAKAWVRGVEGQLAFPRWGRFSGALSYANQLGVAQGPVTGGLFIGAEALAGVLADNRFPISQDQRNTAHASLRFALSRRIWLATESSYGSGLPTELDTADTSRDFLLAQYGPAVLGQVDFARGRVRPSYSLDAGAGFQVYAKEDRELWLQVQGSNLTNHLNVINFAGLFSGTAIAPPRSFDLRMRLHF